MPVSSFVLESKFPVFQSQPGGAFVQRTHSMQAAGVPLQSGSCRRRRDSDEVVATER